MSELQQDILDCIGNTSLSERLGPGATIVTVMCATGMKYLRTYGTEAH
jgi:cysteine synthase